MSRKIKEQNEKPLITPSEAWKIIGAATPLLKTESIPLEKAPGRVLSSAIKTSIDLPPFDNSAMDGFAIRYADYAAGICDFIIVATLAAGHSNTHKRLKKGEAFRIFTGALVPPGCDAIVIREAAEEKKGRMQIVQGAVTQGAHIRKRGHQSIKGSQALDKGHVMGTGSIGYLAGLGVTHVEVYKKPKVSLIITGDELQLPGHKLKPGQVFESNSCTLLAALRETGIEPLSLVRVKDKEKSVIRAIENALPKSDLLILTGGISLGDYDFVKTALPKTGVKCLFYKIAQKPGKPLFFGKKKKTSVFALPGNPASVLTCFYEYVYQAIHLMTGSDFPHLKRAYLSLQSDYQKTTEFSLFLKARIESEQVIILGGQQSDSMQSFAEADCLVYLAPGKRAYKKGEHVEIHILRK
jgi:molybdopterin molybdotransferase